MPVANLTLRKSLNSTLALSGDPKLGTFTGSPWYYPLLADCPGSNAAYADYCLTTDHVGNSRPYPAGAACDIGAYEAQATASATNTSSPMPTPTNTSIPPTAILAPVETTDGTCVKVSPRIYWLFPDGNFHNGLINVYSSRACDGEPTQSSIGDEGYAYRLHYGCAQVVRIENHGFVAIYEPVQSAYNPRVWQCTRLQTDTPFPTTTDTSLFTDTPTATNTPIPAPSEYFVRVGPGVFWLFPSSRFLSGLIAVYPSAH